MLLGMGYVWRGFHQERRRMEVLTLPYLSHLPLCPADEKVNHVGVGMQRVPVESRSLATIGYDSEPQIWSWCSVKPGRSTSISMSRPKSM